MGRHEAQKSQHPARNIAANAFLLGLVSAALGIAQGTDSQSIVQSVGLAVGARLVRGDAAVNGPLLGALVRCSFMAAL